MSVSLFSHDSNPDIDPRLYRQSNARVADLVARGEAFMIDERRAQLFAPKEPDWERKLNTPLAIPGSNSCRMVNGMLKVTPFPSYPIPACGARNRPMSAFLTNYVP